MYGLGRRALRAALPGRALRPSRRWQAQMARHTALFSVSAARPLTHAQTRTYCSDAAVTTDDPVDHQPTKIIKPKNEKDAIFLRALHEFFLRFDHYFVPMEYVVPTPEEQPENTGPPWPEEFHGLDLGLRVRNFTRGITNDYKRAMLRSIGFPYDEWKTYVWEEQLMPCLRIFRELEGHTFVRFPFTIPDQDPRYPKCTWGFKLGFAVAMLRQQRNSVTPEQLAQLEEIDFLWSEHHYKLELLLLPGLQRFKELFGHTQVPPKFTIPTRAEQIERRSPQWPEELEEVKLGYLYHCLQTGFFDSDTVELCQETIEQLGVNDPTAADRAWHDRVLPALAVFPTIFGHYDIPSDFKVPRAAPWPETTWDFELGYVIECVLEMGVFADQLVRTKADVRHLGYRWDVLFGKAARVLLPALRCYQQLYGHCDVPANFIVPTSAPWPSVAYKYHLGRQLQLVRKAGRQAPDIEDALEELDALGFKFDVAEHDFVDKVLPALRTYAQKHGHCDIPRGFVVPCEDDSWPIKTWGLRLGTIATGMRSRKQYKKQCEEHRTQLAEMGFLFPSITTAEVHGHPPHHQQPKRRRAECKGAGSSDKSTTTGTGPARPGVVPLEPYQEQYWNDVVMASFRAYAAQHDGCCDGMADNFVVPSDAPYPQTAWGLNLGLRLRYIRHHQRYEAEVAKYHDELVTLGVVQKKEKDDDREQEL